ncbi:MAG: hypothetical protein ACPG1C_05240 [Alphaproteobacteria bacterium]
MQQNWSFGRALRFHIVVALGVALFAAYALPIASIPFFEAYHAFGGEWLYTIYSVLKGAGVLLPEYGFRAELAAGVALPIFLISLIVSRIRGFWS